MWARRVSLVERRERPIKADRNVILNSFLLEEAACWAARLLSGTASNADYAAWRAWCALSPAHAAAGREVLSVWGLAGPAARTTAYRMTLKPGRHVGAGAAEWRDEDWRLLTPHAGQASHFSFAELSFA